MQAYEALRTTAAWRDLSDRGRILVHGEDNARLLHAMSSNHINALEDSQGCYAFFLNAQGRIQADAHIFKPAPAFLIETEASTHQALFAHLDKYIIADDATLEDLHNSHCAIALEGPEATTLAASFGYPIPPAPHGIAKLDHGYILRLSDTGLDGVRIILTEDAKSELLTKLADTPQADPDAWETVRLEQGQPRFGVEIEDKNLIQETRLLHAVHFTKGCYLGQEIVERVRARGAVHKGIAAISIETTTIPPKDTELCGGGNQAGRILSARFSPAENRTVGFAMLGVDYLSGDKPFTCNGAKASVRPSNAFAPRA
jgi:aminomethyltransferase